MLEYIFFHDAPRAGFINFLSEHNIPFEEVDDNMGQMIAVPEDLGDELEELVEQKYDKLMEDAEELLAADGDEAEKNVAAINITLDDGKIIYAAVDPNVINRMLSVITTQELNDVVNSIVDSVLNTDDRPVCTRD